MTFFLAIGCSTRQR